MTDDTSLVPRDPGLFGRAIGVIVSPGQTFGYVVENPRPAAILLLVAVVFALAGALPQFTETGRQALLDTQVQMVERFGGEVTDQMYAGLEQQARYAGYTTLVSTFIITPISALFFTAIFWALFNAVFGGTATFKQVLGVQCHSMVILALGAALSAPIMLLQGKMTVTGPFNLGALVPMLADDALVRQLLTGINAIQLWQIVVLSIGLGVLYQKKSTGISIALLSIYLLLVAAFVVAFAQFSS